MKKKKVLIVIICLLAVLTAVLGIIFSKKGPISRRNQANLGTLLADLVKASEEGPGAGLDQIGTDLILTKPQRLKREISWVFFSYDI